MRKYFAAAFVSGFAAVGCGSLNSSNTNTNVTVRAEKPEPSPAAAKPAASPGSEQALKPGVNTILKTSKGKYPYEIKLLDDAELVSRLQKLMGPEYAALKANWNVETPIEIENGILMTSGCEQHNCGGNIYYLFFDFGHDNINVYHVKKGTQTYFEQGRIDLPKKFADEIAPAE